jgi:hypothetical protein
MRTLLTTIVLSWACLAFSHGRSLDELVAHEQRNVDNEAVTAYGGKVGKLDAVFLIEWDGEPNNALQGYYYYPSRGRDRMYRLTGIDPKPGVLLLQEYSQTPSGGEVLSANCRLTKRETKDRIIWEGQMENTDGRAFPMSFSRVK